MQRDFARFGEIVRCAIPENLSTKQQTGIAFVTYKYENAANAAIAAMHDSEFMSHIIIVTKASQNSFFSQDTGFITNATLDKKVADQVEFDSTMPAAYYEAKYRNRPIDTKNLLTVKVDGLGPKTS